MKKLSRLEDFLDNYSWLLKSVIVILLFLWVFQGNVLIVAMYQDIKNTAPRNSELEQKMDKILGSLLENMIEKAKLKGTEYGPHDYFNDLKTIEIKEYEIGKGYKHKPPFFYPRVSSLQILFRENVGKNRPFNDRDVILSAQQFNKWLESGGPIGCDFHKILDKKVEENGLLETIILPITKWVWTGYYRGFFLVILLFLVRMASRKGILETILADKRKFILAIVFWPFFLTQYPYNVIKEIVVEAELRRLGLVFRCLSKEEREAIKQIAASRDFWNWLINFSKENELIFQRSFAIALLVVIFINLFPATLEAKSQESKRGDPITYSSAKITDNVILDDKNLDQPHNNYVQKFFPISTSNFTLNLFEEIIFLRIIKGVIAPRLIHDKIEHVPIVDYLFVRLKPIKTQ